MKIAITGHTNIEKAVGMELKYPNGIMYNKKAFDKVYENIEKGLQSFCKQYGLELSELTLISGMARGVDEVFAIFAIRNKMKLILSIPGSIKWHKNRGLSRGMRAQAVYYDKILEYWNLSSVHEVSKNYKEGNFHFVNMARNQQMVDIADGVFSYKSYDSTGTDDCINRAKQLEKYLGNITNQPLF